jgi:HEAT repeat protein
LVNLVFSSSNRYNHRMKVRSLSATAILLLAVVLIAACRRSQTPTDPSLFVGEPVYNGKPLHQWAIDSMNDRNPDGSLTPLEIEATNAVQAIGPNAAVPWLVKWIKSPDHESSLHLGTVNCFRVFGSRADAAVPDLIAILNTPGNSEDIMSAKTEATEALECLGPKAVPAMLAAAANPSLESLRIPFISTLGGFSSNCPEVVPGLMQWTHDPDEDTRHAAIMALSYATQRPDVVVPVLRAALKETNGVFRYMMAESLGDFGKAASNAVPDLIKLLDDPEAAGGAIAGLGKIGEPPDVIFPLLVKKLHDPDAMIRCKAALGLGNFGGQRAFDALMTMTDDSNVQVREEVFQSLKKIDPEQLKQSGKHL